MISRSLSTKYLDFDFFTVQINFLECEYSEIFKKQLRAFFSKPTLHRCTVQNIYLSVVWISIAPGTVKKSYLMYAQPWPYYQ